MIEWLFSFLVLYLLYKLIFDFILPVSRATSQIKNKMNEMNQQQQNQYNSPKPNPPSQPNAKSHHADEYIDYEEIK
jgi:hypothetical protein